MTLGAIAIKRSAATQTEYFLVMRRSGLDATTLYSASQFGWTLGWAVRVIICIGALLGIILGVRSGLYSALDAYGFWPYMAIWGGLTALIIAAAFAWDWHEARSRR